MLNPSPEGPMTESAPLLEVEDLKLYYEPNKGILPFKDDQEPVRAVDGVSLELERNEVIGIIGESGCGKTTLIETLMGLLEPTDGEIRFDGEALSKFNADQWKAYRRRVQIIFQDPFNSLDPKMTVRESLREPIKVHGLDEVDRRIETALRQAELEPKRYLDKLPRELSGGEKQRVSIAKSLVLEPEVILADEPASMLDVSTQASILQLLARLSDEGGLSIIYISHDLSTVSYVCDLINVMYLGRIVESAPTQRILRSPKHPYTQALIQSVPIPDPYHDRARTYIDSPPPSIEAIGSGCRFKDRCPERMDICDTTPRFPEVEPGHRAACHLYYDHREALPAPENAPQGGE